MESNITMEEEKTEDKKEIIEIEDNDIESDVVQTPITRADLDFVRDPEDKNWISKISNGKTVILHRSCEETPQLGVLYHCTITEKESYALAFITGFASYPRFICRADGKCIYTEAPNVKPIVYSNILDAFEANTKLDAVCAIYRRDNEIPTSEARKTITIDVKISDKTAGNSITDTLTIEIPITDTSQDVLDKFKTWAYR